MKRRQIVRIALAAMFLLAIVVCVFVPEAHAGVGTTLMAAPLVTVFTKEIETKLYPVNEFYQYAKDDSMWIKGDKVSRGVAGASPGVSTNPAVPLTASQRADDSNEYNIQLHVTDPQILTRDEELIVNYNKRSSILDDHANVLNTRIADNFAYVWAPSTAGLLLRTTGADVASADGSQTGTRKAVEKQQFIDAFTMLTRQNSTGQKHILIPATMYGQMLAIADFIDYNKTGRSDMLAKGIIGEIIGMKVHVRSYTTLYTNAATPVKKAVGVAGAATDNLSILVWDETSVYKALGKPNVNIENRPATYLGDIINTDVRAGGSARKDGTGVISIVQAAGA